ncbi:MAG: hypothetical protein WDN06_14210 [Asticcacaulis sp.]
MGENGGQAGSGRRRPLACRRAGSCANTQRGRTDPLPGRRQVIASGLSDETDIVGYEKQDYEANPTAEAKALYEADRDSLQVDSDLVTQLQPLYADAAPPSDDEITVLRNTIGRELVAQARPACRKGQASPRFTAFKVASAREVTLSF